MHVSEPFHPLAVPRSFSTPERPKAWGLRDACCPTKDGVWMDSGRQLGNSFGLLGKRWGPTSHHSKKKMSPIKKEREKGIETVHFFCVFFPKQVYLWGSILEKKIDWTRWWARWAWLGADLAVLGALGCWPCCPLAGLGVVLGVLGALWAWGLAVLALAVGRVGRAGRAGWVGRGVGRGVWPCWARWAGVGVGLGDGGRADWVGRGVQSRKVYYRSTK